MTRRGKRGAILWLVLVAVAVAGLAVPAWTPGPRPAGVAVAAPSLTDGVRETILRSGLRVLTKEVRSAPVVSFAVWYKVGSRNEHTGITGVSHLLEHLMFKGTQRLRPGEIARILFVNGAASNASTFYDWTNYYATLASDRLELVMRIEADRMVGSRIDKADLDAEMTVVRSELEGGENNPGRLLWQAVAATAFQAHPYQWPVIGWRSDVENVSRDAIHRFYKTHYGPNTATVVIVGDFDTDRALALVRRHFGGIKAIPSPPPVYTTEPPQRGERRVLVRRAGSLPMALIAYRAPAVTDPDFYALDVLTTILGDGRTSRLYQGLVEKQIASGVNAHVLATRDPFLVSVSATARPGVPAERLEAALLDEVERVKAAPVSDAELARAKSRTEAEFVLRNDSVSAQARGLGYWAMVADWRYLATYLDRIRALTPADLQQAAQKYLVADARTVGHFVPTDGAAAPAAPPPAEGSARVERPKRGDRPIPLPKPAATRPAPRPVARFTLDNGIRVIVHENPASPTFALRGSLNAGSVVEPPDKPGLAGLTASMLTRGTARRTGLEFATELESVGASLSASANTLTTMLSGQALTRDLARLLDLLAEMLTEPAFPEADLDRLRGQLVAGLERARTSPESLAGRAFERAIYPEGNPLRPLLLDAAKTALARITRDDVVGFYRGQYGPDSLILVVTGDVKADRVREALAARLGAWPRNPAARPIPPIEVELQDEPIREVVPVPDKSQATVLWGHAGGLRRSDPDFYATQVMNLILGGGALTSRLGVAIRDERGLVYGIGSGFDASLYPGAFRVGLGANPANVKAALSALEAEIRRIRDHGVTPREVAESVAFLTGRFPVRLETNGGLADVLWAMEFYALGADYIERYADYYRAVTVDQVNAAARRHLRPDRATVVVAGTVPPDVLE
jgi:zinc protease